MAKGFKFTGDKALISAIRKAENGFLDELGPAVEAARDESLAMAGPLVPRKTGALAASAYKEPLGRPAKGVLATVAGFDGGAAAYVHSQNDGARRFLSKGTRLARSAFRRRIQVLMKAFLQRHFPAGGK